MRIASYTVKADARQAVRWHRYAAAEGFASVGAWIAATVERYLKLRDRPVPLFWSRGSFTVTLDCGEMEVSGTVSPPFGTFRGTAAGPKLGGLGVHTLIYLPAGRVLATVRYRREARALAAELARASMRWTSEGRPTICEVAQE